MLISIKILRNSAFLGSDKPRMLFFPLINVKMPTIVGILTFMSRKNFILSRVEHEKTLITSGPGRGIVLPPCLLFGKLHPLELVVFDKYTYYLLAYCLENYIHLSLLFLTSIFVT